MEYLLQRNAATCAVLLPCDVSFSSVTQKRNGQRICPMCGNPTNRSSQAVYCADCAGNRVRNIKKAWFNAHKEEIMTNRRNCSGRQKGKDIADRESDPKRNWADKTSVLSSMPDKISLTDFMAYISDEKINAATA